MTVLNLDRKGHAEVQLSEGIGTISNHRCSSYYIDRLVLWKKILPIFFGGYKKMVEGRCNIKGEVKKMYKRLSGKRKGERRRSKRRQRYSKVERERETVRQRGGWRGQKRCSLPLLSPAFQIPRTSVQLQFPFGIPFAFGRYIKIIYAVLAIGTDSVGRKGAF